MPEREFSRATVPLRRLVPNMITTAALCSGVAALHFASRVQPDLAHAVAYIGVAAFLDGLDGRAARLLKATSRFGETFDSLSDFVCFGVAPAFLLYRFCQRDLTLLGLNLEGVVFMACVLFALCSAMRLARFTAQQRRKKPGTKPSRFFTGMPTPAAAAAGLAPIMLALSEVGLQLPTIVVVGHTLLIAAMMVSRLPMFAFKRLRVSRTWAMPLMLAIGLVVVMAARDAWLTGAALALVYMLTLPWSLAAYRREREGELPDAGTGLAGSPAGANVPAEGASPR